MNRTGNIAKILSIALGLALVAGGCSAQASATPATPVVQVAAAENRALDTDLSFSGVLVPAQTVSVVGKLSGAVLEVKADVGSVVKAGDVLVTIDTETLKTQLKQAQASVKSAKAQAKASKSQASAADSAVKNVKGQASVAKINRDALQKGYDDLKKLVDAGSATQAQLDDIKAKLDVAKAQYSAASGAAVKQAQSAATAAHDAINATSAAVEVAEASVDMIQIQLDNASVKAPIDGVVLTRTINPGEMAAAGTPLLTVADTNTLKLKGTVAQEALPLLKQGQAMDVAVDIFPGKTFAGEITLIGPMSVTTGEYFPIEVSLKNDGNLRAGLTAGAGIKVKTSANVAIPNAAIVKGGGESYVFVVKDGVAGKRAVTVGLTNGTDTEVLAGLSAGEQVAVSAVSSLTDGMAVTVAP